jgi:tryptophan 2,3-dioxygenase
MNSKNQRLNHRGVIAETYEDLQSLHVLKNIRAEKPLPLASEESFTRSILQAVEIALLNSTELINQASKFVQSNDISSALPDMFWLRGFHEILVSLSLLSEQCCNDINELPNYSQLTLSQSPAFQEYLVQLQKFDIAFNQYANSAKNNVSLKNIIEENSLNNSTAQLIQIIRLCSHESTIWERNFAVINIPSRSTQYEEYVGTKKIREMVFGLSLKGKTFFTQFRALHQIPEILIMEMNDHIEQSIVAMKKEDLISAHRYLMKGNQLIQSITLSISPIIEYLTTSDYHSIRENLGLTSGSHSENIRRNLFSNLYTKVGIEFLKLKSTEIGMPEERRSIEKSCSNICLDSHSYLISLIEKEILTLRSFIFHWRDNHMHFPRNVIGGDFTKSLKGAHDSINAVRKMKEKALREDPLQGLLSKQISTQSSYKPLLLEKLPLSKYLHSTISLDTMISTITGQVTKEKFRDVQNRSGVYSRSNSYEAVDKGHVECHKTSHEGNCPFS